MASDPLLWLLTAEAAPFLDRAGDSKIDPTGVARLRRELQGFSDSAGKAAAILGLAELRRRAAAKFPQAARMFFTRKGYEQATDLVVASHKARRYSGCGRVVDACCGIGGDLAALAAAASNCLGIDADPVTAKFAQRNVEIHGSRADVESYELTAENLPDCDAWHVDPDRRPQGHRTTTPDAHQPSLATLDAWRQRVAAGAVKLAPAARLSESWLLECELEWVSHRGECRQLVAWTGGLAKCAGQARATRVSARASATSFVGRPSVNPTIAEQPKDWLHEPDAAVLAARLQGDVARQHGLEAVAPGIAYFTSDLPCVSDLVTSFRVEEVMPLDRKRLAGWLSERGIGRLEIKVRGADVRPEALRKILKPRGDNTATLLIYANATGKQQVVIANRDR